MSVGVFFEASPAPAPPTKVSLLAVRKSYLSTVLAFLYFLQLVPKWREKMQNTNLVLAVATTGEEEAQGFHLVSAPTLQQNFGKPFAASASSPLSRRERRAMA